MVNRLHHSKLIEAKAGCERCAWSVRGNNAQGLAAQHHDRTGHPTFVEVTTRVSYGTAPAPGRIAIPTRLF